MLFETDQIVCYDTHGQQIACQDTGQDASFKQSRPIVSNRFNVQDDSVEERQSGLRWKKNASLAEFPLTWSEANEFVKQLNTNSTDAFGDGWRLPTRRELFSLVSHHWINPSLPENHPFTNIFNGYYWTRTTCSRLPDQAWYVHLGGGRVYRGMKHGSYMVWPVRGKMHTWASRQKRLKRNGSIYFDRHTARTWYVGNDFRWEPCSWQEALQAINRLNETGLCGYSDWRLPNIRELESIVDDSRYRPALVQGLSLGAAPITGLWSATTSTYEPRYAWVLYIEDGAIGVGFKAKADFHVMAVRG